MRNEEKDKKEIEIKESDKLQEKFLNTRSVIISGEITQQMAEKVMTRLLLLQAESDDPITVYVNSQGGHVEAGDTIHDMIQFIKPEVKMVGTGWVASAGTSIYLAAKKENRFSLPNTRYLIHQPHGGAQGQATDIKIQADQIIAMRKRLNKLISDATGQPLEKVEQDTLRDHWFTVDEAIEYGIVGKIIRNYDELGN